MNEDINVRIQELIRDKSMNAAQFADEIGVQRSSISHILSGRNKPSIDFIQKLLQRFKDVDSYWLLTGISGSNKNQNQQLLDTEARVNVVKSNINQSAPSLFDISEKIIPQKPIAINKQIEKIVTFYTDKTFIEHYPG